MQRMEEAAAEGGAGWEEYEVVLSILSFLDASDICKNAATVCKKWYRVTKEQLVMSLKKINYCLTNLTVYLLIDATVYTNSIIFYFD